MTELFALFDYPFFVRAFIGGICAALLCSLMGVFVVLRRSSLVGEGLAHLSFGGIALGLVLSIYPMYIALIFSMVGILALYVMQRKKLVYYEVGIGIVFSFGLALGAILSSASGGFNVDIMSYLFGSIVTIGPQDVLFIVVLAAVVLAFILVFYKELFHLTFDAEGARLSGVPVGTFEVIFNLIIALTVVVSIKVVGSLLVTSLLIIPAASAMQISSSFRWTTAIAAVIGISSVILGLVLSGLYDLATGGLIVMVSIAIFLLCLFLRRFRSEDPMPAADTEGR
ncbi:MAG: metal ABC transporter permease [Methanomassiliicoccales archaeon]